MVIAYRFSTSTIGKEDERFVENKLCMQIVPNFGKSKLCFPRFFVLTGQDLGHCGYFSVITIYRCCIAHYDGIGKRKTKNI